MILSEIEQYIGENVHLNGRGDLAMSEPYRKYLYPSPEVEHIFTIIKKTRSGQVQIKAENGECLTVRAINIDLVENK